MPMQSPAIAAGERREAADEAGNADGATGTAGSNVVVDRAVAVFEAVSSVEGLTVEGDGAVEMSTTRLCSAAVAR